MSVSEAPHPGVFDTQNYPLPRKIAGYDATTGEPRLAPPSPALPRAGRVFIAGGYGLVGSACMRVLPNALTVPRNSLDFRDYKQTFRILRLLAPDAVVLCAAKVGGILANRDNPVEFLQSNLDIQGSVIKAAYDAGVKRLIFLGSNCIYPKEAPLPIQPSALLTGPLEPTNRPYALAKIAGIELCSAYRKQYGFNATSLMPVNLYGPGDNYRNEESHVLPAFLRRFHEAVRNRSESVTCWGTGNAYREFLYSDDLAEAVQTVLTHDVLPEIINVGSGEEVPLWELAEEVAAAVGYKGHVLWDSSKPTGTLRKTLDTAPIRALGWFARHSLREGLSKTYGAYKIAEKEKSLRC